jgi:hypothetical protein
MPLDFTATEVGFDNGMGGASNAAGADDLHYVLFGKDGDGIYFEYDDQIHGGVDQVAGIAVHLDHVVFTLVDRNAITVWCGADDSNWSEFLGGLRDVFPPAMVTGT